MAPRKQYSRCCNPFKIKDDNIMKGLRLASKNLQNKWQLNENNYLCMRCRIKGQSTEPVISDENIAVIPEENIDIMVNDAIVNSLPDTDSTSSKELLTQISNLSQLSLDTQLPVMNETFKLLYESPIPAKKIRNDSYLQKKADHVYCNLKTSLGIASSSNSNFQDNAAHFLDMIESLKVKFHNENTTRAEKIQILTLLPLEWSVKKMCNIMNATEHMVRVAKFLKQKKGILSMPESKLGRKLSEDTKLKVFEFYTDDEVSVIMPGMKDFISIRNDDGQREHVQKRLVLSNLKELYELFRMRCPRDKIGFSMFASLRPKHCVLADASGTHTVCVCAMHQNVKLMLGINLSALTRDLTSPLTHYKDCLDMVICENPSSQCYLGGCTDCPGIEILGNTLTEVLDNNDIDEVTYKHWISKPRTTLETTIECSSEFVDDFCAHVQVLLPHSFIAKEQTNFMKTTKESLRENEFLVMCDFAENYSFVVQNAAPGFHWNNNQASIYPVVIYFKCNGVLTHRSLVIISDSLSHDSVAVYVYSQIVTDFIKTLSAEASKIYYFSDGAPQQFKNFKNFQNLYHHAEDFGIQAEWHFSATAHGKGACDGVGGTVKRMAARASLQLPFDRQIRTPQELYEWASKPNNLPNILVKFSPAEDYKAANEKLIHRFANAKSIPGTLKLHCIIPGSNGILNVKEYSRSEDYRACNIFKRNKG